MNDMEIIDAFENQIANYVGCKFGVVVSSCTNAIFLSLQYLKSIGEIKSNSVIKIPKKTYISVPMSIINAGFKVEFEDIDWSGMYRLKPTKVLDCATRFTQGMYVKDALQCLSFQYRKHLKIGRGGMILTDDKDVYDWLRQARHNGKHPGVSIWDDELEILGWDMYMLPKDCLIGITLLNNLPKHNKDCMCQDDYPDISNQEVFK